MRKKSRAIKGTTRVDHLETWFYGDNEKIESFMHEMSRKVINTPKLLSFNWLKKQNLREVRKALRNHNLRRFLDMNGNIFPNLVKVFYTNLIVDGENMYSHVKRINMKITLVLWTAIIGLNFSGARVSK